MRFTLAPVQPVMKYLRKYSKESKDPMRQVNIKYLLKEIKKGLIPYFAFENEYGEQYLALGWDLSQWWWAGDESDWEIASSWAEDNFVRELLEMRRNHITKVKLPLDNH